MRRDFQCRWCIEVRFRLLNSAFVTVSPFKETILGRLGLGTRWWCLLVSDHAGQNNKADNWYVYLYGGAFSWAVNYSHPSSDWI